MMKKKVLENYFLLVFTFDMKHYVVTLLGIVLLGDLVAFFLITASNLSN